MTPEKLRAMEVRPSNAGWYRVILFQYEKARPEHPSTFRELLHFDGTEWDYVGTYSGTCYVCFIYERLDT